MSGDAVDFLRLIDNTNAERIREQALENCHPDNPFLSIGEDHVEQPTIAAKVADDLRNISPATIKLIVSAYAELTEEL